jgi:hypothetical protein
MVSTRALEAAHRTAPGGVILSIGRHVIVGIPEASEIVQLEA